MFWLERFKKIFSTTPELNKRSLSKNFWLFAAVFFLLLASVVPAGYLIRGIFHWSQATTWSLNSDIDPYSAITGYRQAIVMSSDGFPYVVFSPNAAPNYCMFAVKLGATGAVTASSTLDCNMGNAPGSREKARGVLSNADSNPTFVFSKNISGTRSLEMAHFGGVTWATSTIASTSTIAYIDSGVAYTGAGKAIVAYSEGWGTTGGMIRLFVESTGIQDVVNSSGINRFDSVAATVFTASSSMVVFYKDNTQLKMIFNKTGSWIVDPNIIDGALPVVGDTNYLRMNVSQDASGNPRIYYTGGTSANNLVYGVRNSNGTWTTTTVVTGNTSWLSGSYDSTGAYDGVAFYDTSATALKYTQNSTGSWATETASSTNSAGTYADLAFYGGLPAIAYQYTTSGGTIRNSITYGAAGFGNQTPTAPTTLYSHATDAQSGSANPTGLTSATPFFSAIFNDSDVGDIGNKAQIQITTTTDSFATVNQWDSGSSGTTVSDVVAGARSQNMQYGSFGTAPLRSLNLGDDTPGGTDTTYYWRIKFWDDGGAAGTWSSEGTFTLLDAALAPSAVTAAYTTTTATIGWADNSSNETEFQILKSTDGATYTFAASSTAGTVSTTTSGLTPNTKYWWQVKAYNTAGLSAAASGGGTADDYTQANIPTSVTASYTAGLYCNFDLSWGANSNPSGTEYEIAPYYFPGWDPRSVALYVATSTWASGTSRTFTEADNVWADHTYIVAVRARNKAATPVISDWSSFGTVETLVAPITAITYSSDEVYNFTITVSPGSGACKSANDRLTNTGQVYFNGLNFYGDTAGMGFIHTKATEVGTYDDSSDIVATIDRYYAGGLYFGLEPDTSYSVSVITGSMWTGYVSTTPFTVHTKANSTNKAVVNPDLPTVSDQISNINEPIFINYASYDPICQSTRKCEIVNSTSATLILNYPKDTPFVTTQMRLSNNNTFADDSWQPVQTQLTWQLSPGNGTKTVYVQYKLASGITTRIFSSPPVTLYEGKPAPPVFTYPVNGQKITTIAGTNPIITGTVGGNGYKLKLFFPNLVQAGDNGVVELSDPINTNFSLAGDAFRLFPMGENTITAWAVDPIGTLSDPATITFTLELEEMPTLLAPTLLSPRENEVVTKPIMRLTGKAQPNTKVVIVNTNASRIVGYSYDTVTFNTTSDKDGNWHLDLVNQWENGDVYLNLWEVNDKYQLNGPVLNTKFTLAVPEEVRKVAEKEFEKKKEELEKLKEAEQQKKEEPIIEPLAERSLAKKIAEGFLPAVGILEPSAPSGPTTPTKPPTNEPPQNSLLGINTTPITLEPIASSQTFVEQMSGAARSVGAAAQSVNVAVQVASQQLQKSAKAARVVMNTPAVQTANTAVVVPAMTVAASAAVGTAVSAAVGLPQAFLYLQFLFTQPFYLLRRRKAQKSGVIFNSISNMPVDLAVVRVIDEETNKVVKSRVTDIHGRYEFFVDAGQYRLEVSKPQHLFPSALLAGKTEADKYTNLYNGGGLKEETEALLNYNAPVDPAHTEEKIETILSNAWKRKIGAVVSSFGIISALVSYVVTPKPWILGMVGVHTALFFLMRRLARTPQPKNWGIVLDQKTKQPLARAVVRIFDTQYNKLLETQVTDAKGRYAFLVGNNEYYLMIDKAGFQKFISTPIKITDAKEGATVAVDIPMSQINQAVETVLTEVKQSAEVVPIIVDVPAMPITPTEVVLKPQAVEPVAVAPAVTIKTVPFAQKLFLPIGSGARTIEIVGSANNKLTKS